MTAFVTAYMIVATITMTGLFVWMWRTLYEAARNGERGLDYETLQQPHAKAVAMLILGSLSFIVGTAWLSAALAFVVLRVGMHVLHNHH